MADYLTRLASRTLGLTPAAEPVRAPLFAPEQTAAAASGPDELLEKPNALPSLPRNPVRGQEPSAPGRETAHQPGPRLISPDRQQDLAPGPLSGDGGKGDPGPSIVEALVNVPALGKSQFPYRSEGVSEESLLLPSAASSPPEPQAGLPARAEVGGHRGRKPSPGPSEPTPPSGESFPLEKSRVIIHPAVSAAINNERGPEPARLSSESSPPLGRLPDVPDGPMEIPAPRAAFPQPVRASAEPLLVPLCATEIPLPKQERPGPGRPPGERTPPRDQEAPPVIEITIGRVEVKAVYPPAPPSRPREAGPVAPRLSLEDYLRNQNGGRR